MNDAFAKRSPVLRKIFIEEFQLPIDLVQDPYFSERLITFDSLYNCRRMWDIFLEDICFFDAAEQYEEFYGKEMNALRRWFSDAQEWITNDFVEDLFGASGISLPNPDGEENRSGPRLKFRFKDGGYALLHKLLPEYFTAKSWADLLDGGRYPQHWKYSDRIRDEALKGLRFRNIQLNYILWNEIRKRLSGLPLKLAEQTCGSLIFEVRGAVSMEEIRKLLDGLPGGLGETLDFAFYRYTKIGRGDSLGFFYDRLDRDEVEIVGCEPALMNQLVLYMKRDYISKDDLAFEFCGYVSSFEKAIENPFLFTPRPGMFRHP